MWVQGMHPVNIAYSRLCFAVVIPYIPHSPTPQVSSEVIIRGYPPRGDSISPITQAGVLGYAPRKYSVLQAVLRCIRSVYAL